MSSARTIATRADCPPHRSPGSLPAFYPYRTGRGACPSSRKLSWMIYDRRPGSRRRGWPSCFSTATGCAAVVRHGAAGPEH